MMSLLGLTHSPARRDSTSITSNTKSRSYDYKSKGALILLTNIFFFYLSPYRSFLQSKLTKLSCIQSTAENLFPLAIKIYKVKRMGTIRPPLHSLRDSYIAQHLYINRQLDFFHGGTGLIQ